MLSWKFRPFCLGPNVLRVDAYDLQINIVKPKRRNTKITAPDLFSPLKQV